MTRLTMTTQHATVKSLATKENTNMTRYTATASPVPNPTRTVNQNTFTYGRLWGNETITMNQPESYRALQRECKARGLNASGSKPTLRQRLWVSHVESIATTVPFDYDSAFAFDVPCYECPDEVSTVATQQDDAPQIEKPQANPKKAPKKEHAYTYRAAQRLLKWFKENDYMTFEHKCAGWDNIEANIDALMNTERFWAIVNTPKYAQSIEEFTGLTF